MKNPIRSIFRALGAYLTPLKTESQMWKQKTPKEYEKVIGPMLNPNRPAPPPPSPPPSQPPSSPNP